MIYVRDSLRITAAIAAESQYARVWNPAGKFVSDPALLPIPEKKTVLIHRVNAWVITTLGNNRRGIQLELCNLTDQSAYERFSLPTAPADGVCGPNGLSYNGPPFLCSYGVGWWSRIGALIDTDIVYMRIAWEGVDGG